MLISAWIEKYGMLPSVLKKVTNLPTLKFLPTFTLKFYLLYVEILMILFVQKLSMGWSSRNPTKWYGSETYYNAVYGFTRDGMFFPFWKWGERGNNFNVKLYLNWIELTYQQEGTYQVLLWQAAISDKVDVHACKLHQWFSFTLSLKEKCPSKCLASSKNMKWALLWAPFLTAAYKKNSDAVCKQVCRQCKVLRSEMLSCF